jgi:hypothetical protein
MKKLLFTLLLAAATLPGWAEDLYLVGSAVSIDWNINNAMRATKMTETSANVFEWTGYFKASGQFKILTNKDSWDSGYNATSSIVTLSGPSGIQDRSGGDNQWKVASDGIYKITVNTSDKTIKAESATMTIPTLTDGYYQIGTANDLKNFADAINKGAIEPSVKAKLTADIDMASITDFTPICCANAIKFTGEFDGQGHAITNLAVDYGNSFGYTGLFGYATGGAVIKNLIVGTGCSFKGTAKIGGIIGMAEGSGTVTLTNVINMANVTSTGGSDANAAGLVGCGTITINSTNCANMGEIHGQDGECAAFAGWTGNGTTFTNCWNIGDIYNMQSHQNLYRNPGAVTATNCFDANGADFYTQGTKLARTSVGSGELCYKVNAGGDNWYQNLTSTVDAYPVPFSSHSKVYANASFNCDGTPKGDVVYGNNNEEHHDAHQEGEDGFCSVCDLLMTFKSDFMTPVDGYYEISNNKELCWFAAKVNTEDPNVNARLMNDIDMVNAYSYTPIGKDPNNKYNGTFDGQGFRIKNLTIDNDVKEQGLFSVCNGATIKNLIMDASCTIKSTGVTNAAFVAVCNGSGTLTFENCGNEAKVIGSKNNNAAFLAFNWVAGSNLTVSFRNCYNIGEVSGGWDNCAFIGWNSSSTVTFDNCWNIGTIENVNGDGNNWARSGNSKTLTNCYSTNSTYKFDGALKEVTDAQVADGTLCAKVGYGFRQNIGEGGDAHPNFVKTHGFVAQIGEAGYSTMYNVYSDVTIPSGIEAYAGVVYGTSLSLVAIENKIAASEPVVLKLAEGINAGLFNFMPTSGASEAASNDLKGSTGNVTGGDGIFALARKGEPAKVGFYPVDSSVTIPEGKAYLEVATNTGGGGVKGFTFVFDDDATGISLMEDGRSQTEDGAIYNLAGQRINKMQRGINIVNGKKILK